MKGKILFVGHLAPHCRTYQRFRAMQELGFDVRGISSVPVTFVPGVTDYTFWYKVSLKLKRPLDLTGANGELLKEAREFRPDLIWLESALSIRPGVLRKIEGSRIVFYSEDDMFAPHNQSHYFVGALPLFHTVFTTKSYNCDAGELPALGARRVLFTDKAHDRHAHRPIPLTQEDRDQFSADVAFVGTFEAARAAQLLMLAQAGIPVRVWGNGWGSYVNRHPNLKVENRPVYNDDYIKVLRATRINLCFLRKINRDLQTDRTMELPACAAFMLAERTVEHSRLFAEGTEAAYFDADSDQELLDKVRYYLAHETERQAIAEAGLRRSQRSGYSHHDRLTWMLGQVLGPGPAEGESR